MEGVKAEPDEPCGSAYDFFFRTRAAFLDFPALTNMFSCASVASLWSFSSPLHSSVPAFFFAAQLQASYRAAFADHVTFLTSYHPFL